jgi:hypothetical protein
MYRALSLCMCTYIYNAMTCKWIRETHCLWVKLGYSVLGGWGWMNTGFWLSRLEESQIWDSGNGHESCEIQTWEKLCWRGQTATVNYMTCPLIRESALHQQTYNYLKVIKKRKIGHMPQMGAWHQNRLADWLLVMIYMFDLDVSVTSTVVSQSSSGAAAKRCQPVRIRAVGHGNWGCYTVGSWYQAVQWKPWLRTTICLW